MNGALQDENSWRDVCVRRVLGDEAAYAKALDRNMLI